MFKYILYKLGQLWVTRLPLKVSYRIGMFLSDMQCFFSPRDRQAVTDNLRVLMPQEKDLFPHVRQVFRNFGRYLVEFFRMIYEADKNFLQNHVKIYNQHHLDEALKKGKGAIVLTAHLGNWELGGVILAMLGYDVTAIALPHKERPVNDLFNQQRQTKGMTIVATNVAARRCLYALKENKVVAVVADRDFGMHGEVLDFLGRKAVLPKGPAIFSYKTGAPIIPTFLIRRGECDFDLVFEPAVEPNRVVDEEEIIEEEAIISLMKKYLKVVEEKIRTHPQQWLMFRRFWVDERISQ